jgi:hypothetical protein
MCPTMDSSIWDTKNLEIFWPETTPLALTLPLHLCVAYVVRLHFHLYLLSKPLSVPHYGKFFMVGEPQGLRNLLETTAPIPCDNGTKQHVLWAWPIPNVTSCLNHLSSLWDFTLSLEETQQIENQLNSSAGTMGPRWVGGEGATGLVSSVSP